MTAPFRFDNSYVRDLPGTYLPERPAPAPAPRLLVLNHGLARDLGLDAGALAEGAAGWFSGREVPPGAEPVALAYAGHQFGGFSPQLGDGRAHLLGEIIGPDGRRWDLQLKGSGRTAFSRGGDGKAAVGPMLREYVVSEAMHALGVPTTRSLAVVATGEEVYRETALPGAVLARVAASHIRVGTFQFLAARGDSGAVRRLLDYAIARHYPDLAPGDATGFLDAVAGRQAALIAQWMGLGFVHGVMNTDNMAISGETIDYGPCAFMEGYVPGTVFSSIDHQGRYAYANQPLILGWNLARLAETLLPLIDDDGDRAVARATEVIGSVAGRYRAAWERVMAAKTGVADAALAEDFLAALAAGGADWTLSFRRLAEAAEGDETLLRGQFSRTGLLDAWLPRWRAALAPGTAAAIRAANPLYIPRNHRVEEVLAAATEGDLAPFERLVAVLADPYTERAGLEGYILPAPQGFGRYRTFCGT
jgi:uncharacterized protein YdiU (UPF0061 family)